MTNKEDKCTTPRCRGSPEVEYKGKWLCGKCWENLCDQEAKQEQHIAEQKPKAKEELIYNQDHKQIEQATSQAVLKATQQANLKVYI